MKHFTGFIMKWYRKATYPFAASLFILGVRYQTGIGVKKDELKAMKCFRRAAELGNEMGQVGLGRCYEEGIGVAKDEVEAVKWYRLAADQGSAEAQYILGAYYEEGTGVAKDEKDRA